MQDRSNRGVNTSHLKLDIKKYNVIKKNKHLTKQP